MVQTLKIGLVRTDRQPWGFRLHGGAEYGTPLIIQKVGTDSSLSLLQLNVVGYRVRGSFRREKQNILYSHNEKLIRLVQLNTLSATNRNTNRDKPI